MHMHAELTFLHCMHIWRTGSAQFERQAILTIWNLHKPSFHRENKEHPESIHFLGVLMKFSYWFISKCSLNRLVPYVLQITKDHLRTILLYTTGYEILDALIFFRIFVRFCLYIFKLKCVSSFNNYIISKIHPNNLQYFHTINLAWKWDNF